MVEGVTTTPASVAMTARRRETSLVVLAAAIWGIYVTAAAAGASPTAMASLYAAVSSVSIAACVRASRGAGRSRWTGALAVAIAGYAFSSVYYLLVPDAANRFPSLFDLGLPVFYVFASAAVARLVHGDLGGLPRELWLDAAIATLALMAVGTIVVDPNGISGPAEFGQLAFFLCDLAVLGLLAASWVLRGRQYDRTLSLLVLGLTVLAVADGHFVYRIGQNAVQPTLLQLMGWSGALVVLAAAVGRGGHAKERPSSAWADLGLPTVPALVAVPIALFTSGVPSYCAIAALGLIIVRMVFALADNQRLLFTVSESAIRDPLTGLANRALLLDRLEQAVARLRRRSSDSTGRAVDHCLAILFIDLDDFKAVNDTLGHDAGDALLIAVADALRSVLRADDTIGRAESSPHARDRSTIARLGGDEFLVVLDRLRDASDAALVAERILAELARQTVIERAPAPLSASIGITIWDGSDDREPADVLRDADIAMYAAKRAGRGRYEVFEDEMRDEVWERVRLVSDLRRAFEREELRLLYQPQVELADPTISGVEALVRWEHPEEGFLTPDRFIPLAEAHGMVAELDDWVLRKACQQMSSWDRAALPPLRVAVNISGHRLIAGDLAETVARIAAETGAQVDRLTLEITETVAVEAEAVAIRTLTSLRDLGVEIALDDFGMGHSALGRLQSFPVDRLKIDRSFVASMTPDSARDSLAAAMLAMARSLDLIVTAEGVETEAQFEALRELGCQRAQGYLFSKPVAATEIERLVREDYRFHRSSRPSMQASRSDVRLVQSILSELQRLTGLESTYLTSVDSDRQRITHALNTGALEIEPGWELDWCDTVCRRSLEQDLRHTSDVPEDFDDVPAAQELGLRSYASVPLYSPDGVVTGTLCGASRSRVELAPESVRVMESFARLIEARFESANTP